MFIRDYGFTQETERIALAAGPNGIKVLPHFRKQLADSAPEDRVKHAYNVWRIERKPDEFRELFVQALGSKESLQRYYAFNVISRTGEDAKFAVPKLLTLLGHQNATIVRQSLSLIHI